MLNLRFYNLISRLFKTLALKGWLPSKKLQKAVEARHLLWSHWQSQLKNEPDRPLIWVHCSSLGEFEQASPVIQQLRENFPNYRIAISFFSASGYEPKKNTVLADITGYLPFDHPVDSPKFVKMLNAKLVVWVKYEYWFYTLQAIHQSGVPLLLISAIFRLDQPFFKWYGAFFRRMLGFFTVVFTQNKESFDLLAPLIPPTKRLFAGDTRFDAVLQTAANWKSFPSIDHYSSQFNHTVVVGSSWPQDEYIIAPLITEFPNLLFMITPHEIGSEKIAQVLHRFPKAVCLSKLENNPSQIIDNVIVIDSIGKLKHLYKYASWSYIGGGFNASGIHNTLEAAVFGQPLFFGPNYEKFAEATELVGLQVAWSVKSTQELRYHFNQLLNDPLLLKRSSKQAAAYVQHHAGATHRILQFIQENRLLTVS